MSAADSVLRGISGFPIISFLDGICDSLAASPSHFLVLTAETGAGKSTVFPLALLEKFSGKIIMTEPRRLAALSVADRISFLAGEETGGTVGYKIHLESRISECTRLEVVTEAVLLRYLQDDPSLEGINVVVLDEFHERSVHVDLALAFLREAMELRDDLFVVVMSATIDTEKICSALGGKDSCPVVKVPGRTFPIRIDYDDRISVENAVLRELDSSGDGNILVFLPGISEIRKCAEKLAASVDKSSVEVMMLHSSVSLSEQKKVMAEQGTRRRVIVSSAIAETSLTVPGVDTVIDSGLARVNRLNVAAGMEYLVTEPESEFSAAQRAGRAGRIRPGHCVRLWNEFDPRQKDFPPEICRTDLTETVLECAERGIFSPHGIEWLDPPSEGAWAACSEFLVQTGLCGTDGHITEKGKAALRLGIHPRLAGILLSAAACGERNVVNYALDFAVKYGNYSAASPEIRRKYRADLERRLKKIGYTEEKCDIPLLCLKGYPDRIARRISEAGSVRAEYQFTGGRRAFLHPSLKDSPEWIVAPEVSAGGSEGVIFSFEALPPESFLPWARKNSFTESECFFDGGKIRKTERTMLGQILSSSRQVPASKTDFVGAWIGEIRRKGISALPADEKTKSLIVRRKFLAQQKSESADIERMICDRAEEWLVPFAGGGTGITARLVYDAIFWFLDGAEIDSCAPEFIQLENGRRVKVKYETLSPPGDRSVLVIRPVVEVIVQRIFGCFSTPKIMGMKVLLRLLSPASRPLQVTDDLENFWHNTWPEICREMKGRYPKHNWDYKKTEVEP